MGKEFTVKKMGPLRVGIVGFSMIRQRHPSSRNLQKGDSLELANKWLQELEGQTDLVIVLSHLGVYEDSLLAGTLSGVHVIVGGHTHTVLKKPIIVRKSGKEPQEVYVAQAGKYYENLGRLDLEFDRSEEKGWKLTKVSGRLLALDQKVELDPQIARQVELYRQAVRENKDLPPVEAEDRKSIEPDARQTQSTQPTESGTKAVKP